MTTPGRLFTAMLVAVSVFTPFSASATEAATAEAVAQCVFPLGAYGIVDSNGDLVGMLIIYPDCRTEIIPAREA